MAASLKGSTTGGGTTAGDSACDAQLTVTGQSSGVVAQFPGATDDCGQLPLSGSTTISLVTPNHPSLPPNSELFTVSEGLLDSEYIPIFSGDCGAHGQVLVTQGESRSCTVTNRVADLGDNESTAILAVTVEVDNSSGGTLSTCDAQLSILQEGDPAESFPGAPWDQCEHGDPPISTQQVGLTPNSNPGEPPDTFEIQQSGLNDYVITYSGDCDNTGHLTLEPGQHKSCTLTNTSVRVGCTLEIEICDELDNDCDDLVDEGFGLGALCSTGVGECERTGGMTCTGCSASPGPPSPELCDGLDNDCDGSVDEEGICVSVPAGALWSRLALMGLLTATAVASGVGRRRTRLS